MKTIKFFLIILATITSISFVSCSKDDDNDSAEAYIVGTWKDNRTDEYGGYFALIFNEDGTGTECNHAWNGFDMADYNVPFTYYYNKDTKELVTRSSWSTRHYEIAKLTKSRLEMYCKEEGNRLEIYNRQ